MISLNEIRSAYTKEKRESDKDSNLWIYLVMRRLSFYPTWACLKLAISANQSTLVSIIFGILGCIFLAFGGHSNIFIGAILVNIWTLFDCVDGNLARLTKPNTKYGFFIDSLTGLLMSALLFISIGIGVFNHPDYAIYALIRFLPTGIQIDAIKPIFLVLGAVGSLAALFYAIVFQLFESQFFQSLLSINPKNNAAKKLHPSFLKIGKYLTGFGLIEPLLLIAALLNSLSLLVVFYALTNTSAATFVIFKSIRTAKKIE